MNRRQWLRRQRRRRNYALNPTFATDSNADGTADGVTEIKSTAGSATFSIVAGRTDACAQRMAYTSGSDTDKVGGAWLCTGTAGDFAVGDKVTISFYAKGTATGCTANIYVGCFNSSNTEVGSSSTAITLGTGWTRHTYANITCPATTSYVRARIRVTGVDTGDSFDITVDDVMVEKSTYAGLYRDGRYLGWRWAGVPNASASLCPA